MSASERIHRNDGEQIIKKTNSIHLKAIVRANVEQDYLQVIV